MDNQNKISTILQSELDYANTNIAAFRKVFESNPFEAMRESSAVFTAVCTIKIVSRLQTIIETTTLANALAIVNLEIHDLSISEKTNRVQEFFDILLLREWGRFWGLIKKEMKE